MNYHVTGFTSWTIISFMRSYFLIVFYYKIRQLSKLDLVASTYLKKKILIFVYNILLLQNFI